MTGYDHALYQMYLSASVGGLACVMLSRTAVGQALDKVPAVRDALLHGMARRIHELDQRV